MSKKFHDFLDVFDRKAAEVLPLNRTYDHKIEIDSDRPLLKSQLYLMSQFKLQKMKEYLKENLQKGFITLSNASYASLILFAQKSNDDLRFCVDYQKLNALTKKDQYSLPLINETLAQMTGCKFITKFNIIAAFNKLCMDPGSEDLTTFITSMRLYKYCVLPFSLTNGPASYQHYMNNILLPFLNDFVQAYLDDIIIYSKTWKEHTQHVWTVLQKLHEADLQVNIKKSEFYMQETIFLSLLVSTEELKMNLWKIEVIIQWVTSMKLVKVQSFIGFCNFYRRFIKDFSKIVRPLTRLAQKDTPFEWNETCQTAFESLKKQMTEASVLRHFDQNCELYLKTDSSDYVNSDVLLQKNDDDILHSVAFYSKNLLLTECNYKIYDKELLAIIWCFEHWRPELKFSDISIKVFTDHKSLQHFMTMKKLTWWQVWWAEKLSEFNFVIIPRPGKQNGKADTLTQMTDSKPQNAQNEQEKFQQMTLLTLKKFSVFCMNTNWEPVEVTDEPVDIVQPLFERICQANIADELCSELHTAKSEGKVKCHEITLQHCFIHKEALYQHESLWVSANNELILKLIQEVHVLSSDEHKGINQTVKLIKRYYHWLSMQRTVNQYIWNCYECKQSKSSKNQKNELLNSLLISEQHWVNISMNFITGLPTTKDEKNAILNVMDCLSKEHHYIACTSDDNGTMTEETLKMLIHWVYWLHSMPAFIVSDWGPQFVSTMWKSFCKHMGIQINLSTAFHPKTDDQTE